MPSHSPTAGNISKESAPRQIQNETYLDRVGIHQTELSIVTAPDTRKSTDLGAMEGRGHTRPMPPLWV